MLSLLSLIYILWGGLSHRNKLNLRMKTESVTAVSDSLVSETETDIVHTVYVNKWRRFMFGTVYSTSFLLETQV